MSLIHALLGLLCWAVSNVESYCYYTCRVPHCTECICGELICYECASGYTLSASLESCDYDSSLAYTPYYARAPSSAPASSYFDDDEEEDDDNRGSFVGILLLSVLLYAIIYAIVRCRKRQLETSYAPSPAPYFPQVLQGQNFPSAQPPPFVPYTGQGMYGNPGTSRGPPTYNPLPNEPMSSSSDSNE